MTHPHPKGNFVPKAVLMKSGIKTLNTDGQNFSKEIVSVNTARPINTVYPRPTVNSARTTLNVLNRAHSHVRSPFNNSTTNKNSNLKEKVNTVKGNVTTVGPKAVGNPQLELKEKGVIDSGCSKHMTGNKSYLSDYEEIDGGFVAFRGDPKGGRITGKGKISTDTECVVLSHDFKLLDENHWMLLSTLTETSLDLSYYDEIDVDCCLGGDPKGEIDGGFVAFGGDPKGGRITGKGRKPALSFMRPFGCPVTILNTIDHLGMFDGKADEGFFIGYSTIRKHSQGYSTSKLDGGKAREKDAKDLENEDSEVPNTEEPRVNQEQDANVNITNNIDTIVYSDDDEGFNAKADMTNLDTHILVSPTPTTRIHKDHPLEQIIRDIHSAPQTRRMTKNVTEHVEPKKNKKDERGIVIRNKARLVAQGYTQKEGIDYDESWHFYNGKIEDEVYDCQPPGFEDPEFLDRVYKVEKALYGLYQALKAWYENLSTYLLDNGFQRDELTFFLGLQVTQKDDGIFISQDMYVDEILKKFDFLTVNTTSTPMKTSKPLIKDENAEDVDVHLYRSMIGSLMYLTSLRPDIMFDDSPFDLEAYTDNDYAGASLDRKSTIGGCQFLKSRLISWQCKKQNVVANSTTEVEDSYEKRLIQVIKIHTDHNVADLLTKAFDVSRFQYLIARWLEWSAKDAKDEIKAKVSAARLLTTARLPLELQLLRALKFVDSHNNVACLEKSTEHANFDEIVDFLNASPIRYALTTYKRRKTKRPTEISQFSGPTTLVADEIIHEERGDSMERVVTTAASLDAEQDSGNIIRTQSMETLNEPIPLGTGSGSGPRRQDTILGDWPAQTRFKRLSKQSNDSPLSGVNTPGSKEDRLKIMELMEIYTKLSDRVLALENVKTAQDLEITSLKKRVKKLEKKKKARTPQLKRRLFKGRYDHDIDVTIVSAPITTAGVSVSTAEPSTLPTTTTVIEDDDLTIAHTLMKMRSEKSKEKAKERGSKEKSSELAIRPTRGVTMQEPSKSGTRKAVPPSQHDLKDKGKSKMIEPEKPLKKKDQIKFHKEVAKRLDEELEADLEEEEKMLFDKEMKRVYSFVLIDSEVVEGSGKKTKSSRKETVSKERVGEEIDEESVKRQKLEIIKADGSTKFYKIFTTMLDDFNRQDVLDLYRLEKERFETTSSEGYDRLLWGDLITLFEPSEEDEIWKAQQDYTLISWRLYDSCGVHVLLMDIGITIHMMVEKKYPLTSEMLSRMLSGKLKVNRECEMAL
ncbi:putative ribonuclease H-like domain-containing protein [Tanacetum coccineum]